MIVFLSTKQHAYTLTSLRDGGFGAELPEVQLIAYEDVLLAEQVPRATYVFTDIERLTVWERIMAADIYRQLQAAGCRCLNDPARVMTRYTLLRNLHAAGINPFRIWRLDDAILAGMIDAPPRRRGFRAALVRWRTPETDPPALRFPVFLRTEADHERPITEPLPTQQALADAVAKLRQDGVPVSGVMIIEFCAQPLRDGVWIRWGTARIGDMVSTDHAVIEDNWCVKGGTLGLADDEIFVSEHAQVTANAHAAAIRPGFEIGGIEYGRADHATVNGKTVIYEINTNPSLAALQPQRRPIRDETLRIARERFATGLYAVDGAGGEPITLVRNARAQRHAHYGGVPAMQFRP